MFTTLTLGGMTTKAEADDQRRHRWTALDMRAGLMVGKTFAERFVPFVSARAFAGPVMWQIAGDAARAAEARIIVGVEAVARVPVTIVIGGIALLEGLPLIAIAVCDTEGALLHTEDAGALIT